MGSIIQQGLNDWKASRIPLFLFSFLGSLLMHFIQLFPIFPWKRHCWLSHSLFTQEHLILYRYVLSWLGQQTKKNYTWMFITWPINTESLSAHYESFSNECINLCCLLQHQIFTSDGHVQLLLLDPVFAEMMASFTPKFYYGFITTRLNCLLFQGNSKTPSKTQYFHQITELFPDISVSLDSSNFMELLIASPNISQTEHDQFEWKKYFRTVQSMTIL